MNAPAQDQSPEILNQRYRLDETIGSGGMAMVYKAQDLMLERPVALKLLRKDFSHDDNFRQQFRREAQAAANLSHPNIATIHDFGFDDGRLYIVLEYLPGRDLKHLIRTQGKLPVRRAVELILQACNGIGYAHRAGIVHCDVKPHNMLVSEDDRLKVTDFGIARVLATINPAEKIDEVWGSPQYFSPEQARGMPPSPASDVYSLGVVLYETLTGCLPFTATDAHELALAHQQDAPPSPRSLNPEIPAELDDILLKVLSKEPSQRYRSADQFGRVLTAFLNTLDRSGLPADPVLPVSNTDVPPVQVPSWEQTPVRRTASVPPSLTAQTIPPPPTARPAPSAPPRPGWQAVFDLPTLVLGIVVLILLSGLIPFWIFILAQFNLLA